MSEARLSTEDVSEGNLKNEKPRFQFQRRVLSGLLASTRPFSEGTDVGTGITEGYEEDEIPELARHISTPGSSLLFFVLLFAYFGKIYFMRHHLFLLIHAF